MAKDSTCEVVLIRHGHSTANLKGILAGRNNRVGLTPRGKSEAKAIATHFSETHFDAIYSSPLKRCIDTAEPLLQGSKRKLKLLEDLVEMEYGSWSGKPLRQLSKEPLWKSIQTRPSTVRFPGGESFLEMSQRANQAVLDAAVGHQRIAIFSHGDVIKAIVAFHLGMPLDSFQRIGIDPASISTIRLPSSHLTLMNSTAHLKSTSTHDGGKRDQYTLGGGAGKI